MGRAVVQRGRVRDEFLRALMRGDEETSTSFDLNEAILSATAMADREVGTRAKVITRLDRGVQVYGNAHQLVQMFVDLLIDAANAFEPPNDGSNIIVVTTERVGDCVIVRFADNAPGARPMLFVITDDVMTAHEGHVHVQADPEHGMMLQIVLPHAELFR